MHHHDYHQSILRLPGLEKKTGLKKTSIYKLIKDGTFPAPVRLTDRAVGWHEHEVNNWLSGRQRAEL